MDDLPEYINQSIKKGYSEVEIRNNLKENGWQESQIDVFFQQAKEEAKKNKHHSHTSKTKNDKKSKSNNRLHLRNGKLYLSVVTLFVVLGAMLDINYLNQPSKIVSFSTVMTKFVKAMQDHNKQQLNSLLTPVASSSFNNVNGNIVSANCQSKNSFCSNTFSPSIIKASKKTIKSYITSKGLKGKEVIYTQSHPIIVNGCRRTNLTTLVIMGVPVNRSWKINKVKVSNSINQVGTCLVEGVNIPTNTSSLSQSHVVPNQLTKLNPNSTEKFNQNKIQKSIVNNQREQSANHQSQGQLKEITLLLSLAH